jgi:hypothetical protein
MVVERVINPTQQGLPKCPTLTEPTTPMQIVRAIAGLMPNKDESQ